MGKRPKSVLAFTQARIITPDSEIPQGTLVLEGASILSVGASSAVQVPPEAEQCDCSGKILVPGFIDLHLHGGGGHDLSDQESLAAVAQFHGSCGSTSLVPTLCPDTVGELAERLARLSRGVPTAHDGPMPEILGYYLEGPFLSQDQPGIFDPTLLSNPQPESVRSFHQATGGKPLLMTLAPELPGSMETIQAIREAGMIPCLGHSDATFDQASAAIEHGLVHATHLFNAMRGFHHREPGCAVAALLHPEVSVEVIIDGYHLHKATVQMIYRLKGADKMILVSDASPLAGQKQGRLPFAGRQVEVQNGRAVDSQGRLAGSLLTLADAVRRAVRWAGIPLKDAVRMACLNPARLLGVEVRKGALSAGADADLVILSESLEVEAVYVRGTQVPLTEN